MRVLVVEDEPKMAALIQRVLTAERHVVDVAPDGETALGFGEATRYDVVILDRMLPDIDGLEVLRRLRRAGQAAPVLVLTALGAVEERVNGLDAGADDYLPKPFAFSELLARLRALARRPADEPNEILAAGQVEIDELRHVASVGGQAVELSAREFELLGFFVRNAGRILTRQQIIDGVWDAEPVESSVVDLYVHYLRRKLGVAGQVVPLETVRGVGYMLRAEP